MGQAQIRFLRAQGNTHALLKYMLPLLIVYSTCLIYILFINSCLSSLHSNLLFILIIKPFSAWLKLFFLYIYTLHSLNYVISVCWLVIVYFPL